MIDTLEVKKQQSSYRTTILLYHQIGETLHNSVNPDCFCRKEKFCQQMEYLKSSSIEVVSLDRAITALFSEGQPQRNQVVLTFDDGCGSFYDVAHPILEKCGFPATIYPVVGSLGQVANWGGKVYPHLKILDQKKLIALSNNGVEIGGHTVNHVKLDQVPKTDAVQEIKNCKVELEQILNKEVTTFAFPHGKYNSTIIEMVKRAGFKNALTCESNYANNASSVFEIPRRYITNYDDLRSFEKKLL